MRKEDIERINALARKKKTVGLTEEESAEHHARRQQYLSEMREMLAAQLDRVYIENEDGQYEKLKKKS